VSAACSTTHRCSRALAFCNGHLTRSHPPSRRALCQRAAKHAIARVIFSNGILPKENRALKIQKLVRAPSTQPHSLLAQLCCACTLVMHGMRPHTFGYVRCSLPIPTVTHQRLPPDVFAAHCNDGRRGVDDDKRGEPCGCCRVDTPPCKGCSSEPAVVRRCVHERSKTPHPGVQVSVPACPPASLHGAMQAHAHLCRACGWWNPGCLSPRHDMCATPFDSHQVTVRRMWY
jgi:hypothetical protein